MVSIPNTSFFSSICFQPFLFPTYCFNHFSISISGGKSFELLQEFPVHLLARLEEVTGREAGEVVVALMEYGPDFSGPDKDTFRVDRATGDPLDAHRSNFLHPVFYYYRKLPTGTSIMIAMFHSCRY